MVKPPSAFSQQFRIPEKVQVKPTIASFILLALMAFHVVRCMIALSYMYIGGGIFWLLYIVPVL